MRVESFADMPYDSVYIKTVFYNSEGIQPVNMKLFVHVDFLVE